MENVIKIFEQIKNTSGKNDKVSIVAANKDNELFKKCLVFLLDASITTGIKKTSLKKKVDVYYTIDSFNKVMNYLKENNTGRDVDISLCKSFVESQPEEYRWFYEGMITKTLKLGMDYKSVNKAIPNLIHKHEVMLGSPYDKLKLKDGEWFSLSQKMNGNRCSWTGDKLMSRQGKEWKGLQHIIDDIHRFGLDKYFLDGELIRKNTDRLSDGENFRIGTGVLNSDTEDKNCIEFVIFDMFPINNWLENGCSKNTYKERKTIMEILSDDIDYAKYGKGDNINIRVVPFVYEGTDQSEIMKHLDIAVANDWEGLMLAKDSIYQSKRSTDLIKIKKFLTCDLKVVDVLEGDGRLKGTLGALVVEYKGNTVNVGSGYTDQDRASIWANKDDMIGSIIEVKYKEETMDKKTGLKSIQFPIFQGIREDKAEESYN